MLEPAWSEDRCMINEQRFAFVAEEHVSLQFTSDFELFPSRTNVNTRTMFIWKWLYRVKQSKTKQNT